MEVASCLADCQMTTLMWGWTRNGPNYMGSVPCRKCTAFLVLWVRRLTKPTLISSKLKIRQNHMFMFTNTCTLWSFSGQLVDVPRHYTFPSSDQTRRNTALCCHKLDRGTTLPTYCDGFSWCEIYGYRIVCSTRSTILKTPELYNVYMLVIMGQSI